MSRIKEYYHEEITWGLELLREAQILEQEALPHELDTAQTELEL